MDSTLENDRVTSLLSLRSSRLPDDTVFYAIFPDFSLSPSNLHLSSLLHELDLQILSSISPYLNDYIWQHESFTLSSYSLPKLTCICSSSIPHLHGKLHFGDNLEDEWFVVFMLFHISRQFPSLSIRVWDTDGEFLLIESAFHLPRWINPENSLNRVFLRSGHIHIIPKNVQIASLENSLSFLIESSHNAMASDSIQLAVRNRISEYPEKARKNMHRARVRVPASVAHVLQHEPCLISLAVEGFYDRDTDTMKYAVKMERFLREEDDKNLVLISVRMSRAMYAQIVQQEFQTPKCYPVVVPFEASYMEAELGMKIACGFEMMYQLKKHEGSEGKGRTWDAFRGSLEQSGYFAGLLPGSKEHKRLMQKAEEYYRSSSTFSRARDIMNSPVNRIDEILALPYSSHDFVGEDVPPSDDDGWLDDGEEELNFVFRERKKEMELYEAKCKKGEKSQELDGGDDSDNNLGNIARSMRDFVENVSSYKGAEVPQGMHPVDIDVDRFMKDIEHVRDGTSDTDEVSSSDPGLEDFDEDSDGGGNFGGTGDEDFDFMQSYSDVLNKELKDTTIWKGFVSPTGQSSDEIQGSVGGEATSEDFDPVDLDMNLVKSLLDSFSSQQGLPGPASNLLGLMGLHIPSDSTQKK